ncbi:MAG: RagB/SusD family nutrient uptake outer membrane protein, partial [Bacteroidota bacterium]|nr:RagB/SusD family nutrient uptake outer membrane protein [Bacteroidota bacterium]
MKNTFNKAIVFLTVAFGLVSCNSFFDLQPLTQVPAATYFQDDATVQSGLAACYGGLYMVTNNGMRELDNFPGITDDGYTDHPSWQSFIQNTLNNNMTGDLNVMYSNTYEAIYKANNFIAMVSPTNVIDATKKAQYIAEAKVLRAYEYFFITNIFGDA